jgi:hypothetical protein
LFPENVELRQQQHQHQQHQHQHHHRPATHQQPPTKQHERQAASTPAAAPQPAAAPAHTTTTPAPKAPATTTTNDKDLALTKHQEKVVNGIKHELDRLQPSSADMAASNTQGRKLRSQEGVRFKSELSAYFPEYDEVIGNISKEYRTSFPRPLPPFN